ncbi:MAG: hypothetical protein HYZ49_20070 [Chloroflexi bacterium]|nr:hypothetical protein [Chloroflexota bacterium]
MKIMFERSGGVAGMRVTTTVNTDTLPANEAQMLREMVDKAKFFDLPAVLAAPKSNNADRFQYKLTVEVGNRRHTVETGETAAPPTLQPLIQRLGEMAKKR